MPITAFVCRGCNNRIVPLDHFATSKCGETVCHPDYAAAVLADRNTQPEGIVRVSHGLSCPRRAAIEQAEGYALDPLDALPASSGTAWHAWVEPHGKPWTEVEVEGVLGGVRVRGKMDRVRGDTVEDWKTVQFMPKEAYKPEHRVQTSFYGHMAGGKTRGRIWYKTHFDQRAVEFPLMPVEEALEFKPYGGEYTCAELYVQAERVFTKGERWQDLPLAGRSMTFGNGKTLCDWCGVRETCTVAAMGAPF